MKNNIPLFILGLVVVATVVWFLTRPEALQAPLDTATATSTETAGLEEKGIPDVAPAPQAPSGGLTVVAQTVWKNYVNELWKIEFKYKPEGQLSVIKSKAGDIDQITITSSDMNVFLSRNIRVAEPALLDFKSYDRTIAGQKIEVHEYTKPNEDYAFYLFFVLPVGGDKYYISINSITDSKQPAYDFINRITVK